VVSYSKRKKKNTVVRKILRLKKDKVNNLIYYITRTFVIYIGLQVLLGY